MAEVDILYGRREPQFGLLQAQAEPVVAAYRCLAVDQQGQAIFKAEGLVFVGLALFLECLGHGEQAQLLQLFYGRLIQHLSSPQR
jgi:hypothetical protein